jgi:hypothetical protein
MPPRPAAVTLAFAVAFSLFSGCVALAAPAHVAASVRELPSPAAPDSQCSNLTAAPDGTLHLTYYGPPPAGAPADARTLWLASLPPGPDAPWSAPRPIVTTPLLMENWADFASLVVGTDGALTAQWFQKSAPDARGYDGWYSRSEDGGRTWRTPARLGHEFVALAPLSQGRTLAVWLESTRAKKSQISDLESQIPAYAPTMKLLARLLAPDGTTLGEWTVDPDVCTCCQNTAAVLPADRVFIAYRGHTADEIRDNRHTTFDLATRTFTPSERLHPENWKISACPVNGPAADTRGDTLGVAWFTAADGQARVRARLATDSGRTLLPAVTLDLGKPLGRVETVVLADGSAVVLWLELGQAENAAGLYVRRLFPDGRLSAPALLAESTQARASGFPRAALRPDGRILMSYTRAGEKNRVSLLAFDPTSLSAATRTVDTTPLRSSRPAPAALEFCASPAPSAPSALAAHP